MPKKRRKIPPQKILKGGVRGGKEGKNPLNSPFLSSRARLKPALTPSPLRSPAPQPTIPTLPIWFAPATLPLGWRRNLGQGVLLASHATASLAQGGEASQKAQPRLLISKKLFPRDVEHCYPPKVCLFISGILSCPTTPFFSFISGISPLFLPPCVSPLWNIPAG